MIPMLKNRQRATRSRSVPYEEMGQGDQTVLFLHGLFSSPEHWRPIMEDLADKPASNQSLI